MPRLFLTKQQVARVETALEPLEENEIPFSVKTPEDVKDIIRELEAIAKQLRAIIKQPAKPEPDIWPAPALKWEHSGPNLHTEIVPGVELFIGKNDITGLYTVTVRGRNTKITSPAVIYRSLKTAKASAQRVADLIVAEVQ